MAENILNSSSCEFSLIHSSDADFVKSKFCCFRIAYFPIGDFSIIEHWRKKVRTPILMTIAFILTFVLFFVDTFDSFPDLMTTIIVYSVFCFCAICVTFSYLAVIIKGPGYLPYNWSLTHKKKYTWNEMMKSIALYKDQADFAHNCPDRPKRSCFSNDARRYVLRADHLCIWTESWIGINNHRYFVLLCFWSTIYSLINIGFRLWLYIDIFENKRKFQYWYIPGIASIVFLLFEGGFSIFYFLRSFRNLTRNVTMLEQWRNEVKGWDRGCCNNFEEVCGSRKYAVFWPFPFVFCLQPLEDGLYDDDQIDSSIVTDNYIHQGVYSEIA